MAHVGIQRLAAGHRQKHRSHHQKTGPAIDGEKRQGIAGIKRRQNLRRLHHARQSQQRYGQKPQHHDRPEIRAHPRRAARLNQKQPHQNDEGDGDYITIQQRGGDVQPLDRAQHRNRRRNHAIAIEQPSPKNPQSDQPSALLRTALEVVGGQRQ